MEYCPNCSRPRRAARWGVSLFFQRMALLKCPCGYIWADKLAKGAGAVAPAQRR